MDYLCYLILLFLYKKKKTEARALLHEYNEQFVLINLINFHN